VHNQRNYFWCITIEVRFIYVKVKENETGRNNDKAIRTGVRHPHAIASRSMPLVFFPHRGTGKGMGTEAWRRGAGTPFLGPSRTCYAATTLSRGLTLSPAAACSNHPPACTWSSLRQGGRGRCHRVDADWTRGGGPRWSEREEPTGGVRAAVGAPPPRVEHADVRSSSGL
jgi:hypothetical protein